MRDYFRRVALSNGLLPQSAVFKHNGTIRTNTLSDKRKRGSFIPTSGPLKGCVLGAKPKFREGYARIIAFSILPLSETCENSLMVTAQEAHISAIELIFKLELALREKITSVVIYEAWNTKSSVEYFEKITIVPVAELLFPLKWRYAQIRRDSFSCMMYNTAEMLKGVSVASLEALYRPSFFLFQGFEQLGIVTPRLRTALKTGLEANEGPLLSHVLVINGASIELRLNRDYFSTPEQPVPEMAEAI